MRSPASASDRLAAIRQSPIDPLDFLLQSLGRDDQDLNLGGAELLGQFFFERANLFFQPLGLAGVVILLRPRSCFFCRSSSCSALTASSRRFLRASAAFDSASALSPATSAVGSVLRTVVDDVQLVDIVAGGRNHCASK